MTLRIVFRRPAKREFDDAADRYDEQRQGLGEEFIVEIDQAVAKAATDPERFPIVFGEQLRAAFHIPCTSGFAGIQWLFLPYFTVTEILPYGSVGDDYLLQKARWSHPWVSGRLEQWFILQRWHSISNRLFRNR